MVSSQEKSILSSQESQRSFFSVFVFWAISEQDDVEEWQSLHVWPLAACPSLSNPVFSSAPPHSSLLYTRFSPGISCPRVFPLTPPLAKVFHQMFAQISPLALGLSLQTLPGASLAKTSIPSSSKYPGPTVTFIYFFLSLIYDCIKGLFILI